MIKNQLIEMLFLVLFLNASCQDNKTRIMDTYSDGNIKTIIEYVNPYDTSDFKLIGFYNSGDTNLVISVSQDMRNGISTYFYENGTMKYRISYKNDQLHGKVTYWYPNGQLWQKAYFNYGQIDDTICDYYESGIIKSIGLFNNGTGEFKYYHPNGRLWKTGKVLNGKEEGNWFYYYSNGIKSGENVYKNGKRIGEYKAFYNTGELMEVGIYDSNLIVQNTFYYKNGEINFEMTNLAQRSRNLVLWTDEQKETLISDCIIEKLKENKYRGDDYCYCIVDKIELLRSYTDYLKETDQERREMMQLIDRLCEYE